MIDKLKSYSWVFPVVWMGVIFIFSHQPGNESSELSSGIMEILLKKLAAANITIDDLTLHDAIRTVAHFIIFFILGYLWYTAFRLRDIRPGNAAFISFIISAAYAFVDEAHQYFIPGRACELKDVMVDSLGAGCSVALGWFISTLRNKWPYKYSVKSSKKGIE